MESAWALHRAWPGADLVITPDGGHSAFDPPNTRPWSRLRTDFPATERSARSIAIFQFRPSPICMLDEVDAPLDEENVGRFADLMHALSKETQFLVVTHSKRMMQSADMIYGVTMQKPRISKVLSLWLGSHEPQRITA